MLARTNLTLPVSGPHVSPPSHPHNALPSPQSPAKLTCNVELLVCAVQGHADVGHQAEEGQNVEGHVEPSPDAGSVRGHPVVQQAHEDSHPSEGHGAAGHISRVAGDGQQLTAVAGSELAPPAGGPLALHLLAGGVL